MRIFEVKNNLVKIFYETSDNLFLSGFVMIKDSRESYIGQIMHLESSKHGNVAIAKIIFNVTEDGVITTYSGTIPAINSAISNINSNNQKDEKNNQTIIHCNNARNHICKHDVLFL